MLVRTILLPSVFTSIPEEQASLYSLTIKLLQELEKTGVILVDDKNCIKAALSQGISEWPEKFKKPAQKLLKKLWKNHRFVEVSLRSDIQSNCGRKQCQPCIRIAKEYLPLAVLARQECNSCANKQLTEVPTVKVIDIEEYSIDDDLRSHLNERGRILGKGEWNQDKFEQEILIPLFRDAKHIKIYDRWVGRSTMTNLNGQIADNYKLTLEWILDLFVRESRLGVNGIFEVYTGLDTRRSKAKVPTFVASLRSFESDMRKAYSFPNFQVSIKEETQADQMPHERYLITNQVAISIDRGFDLLLEKRTSPYPRLIRDVCIDYCSEPGKIEQAVGRLPNL